MSYILSDQRDVDCAAAFDKYESYLVASKERLPATINVLLREGWWFDFRDHRCPHDSWVEELKIKEGRKEDVRTVDIYLRLLGAYHDGHLEIAYKGVKNYELSCVGDSHGDWRYDQFLVAGDGFRHEIEWDDGTIWKIVAEDFEYVWKK
ncbi:hypothetical protein [Pelagicoccus sp. SDUM812005]|uniref:hypothetical protein n=1 Tax=Pelagicoccus sp. SDUM812005 TaxID=3041257 RepID=UPI00280F0448|nr:hypothetical protein [Pelagicoccus sp. SDUM812005]MDQ8183419.1 hypothetical protein [Pelagicoccus sp. SDUM812005]